jgi:hypothetical protein
LNDSTHNQATACETEVAAKPPPARSRFRRLSLLVAGLLVVYLVLAYVLAPLAWRRAVKTHPDLSSGPRITHTASGIPGDPVNLALVGSESELIRAMTAAKWYPADPITLQSSLRIAVDSVFRRPDDEAPMSDLFLFGRKQDLAFELPVGASPRQRHHVRFWRWDQEREGQPVWFGAATFDERVGLSHTTGQITHHIGPDVDAERDRIMQEFQTAGKAGAEYYSDGFHHELQGKNGGGDPWHTDGRLGVVILNSAHVPPAKQNDSIASP